MGAGTKQEGQLSETAVGKHGAREVRARVAKVEADIAILRAELAQAGVAAGTLRAMNDELQEMRKELRESEIVVAAANLRTLNEALAHEGIGRLRQSLHKLRNAGIIDERGNLVPEGLPQEMRDAPDAV